MQQFVLNAMKKEKYFGLIGEKSTWSTWSNSSAWFNLVGFYIFSYGDKSSINRGHFRKVLCRRVGKVITILFPFSLSFFPFHLLQWLSIGQKIGQSD